MSSDKCDDDSHMDMTKDEVLNSSDEKTRTFLTKYANKIKKFSNISENDDDTKLIKTKIIRIINEIENFNNIEIEEICNKIKMCMMME